jgi:hypothetical protein
MVFYENVELTCWKSSYLSYAMLWIIPLIIWQNHSVTYDKYDDHG